jgi:hypothetical protein
MLIKAEMKNLLRNKVDFPLTAKKINWHGLGNYSTEFINRKNTL